MNVRIASETLSNSVADSMDFLRSEDDRFINSGATSKYTRIINDIFDVMNSTKAEGATGFKRPISLDSHHQLFAIFNEAIPYLRSLSVEGESNTIFYSQSGTPFIGFYKNMTNLMRMYEDYVKTGLLTHLIVHRICQDHRAKSSNKKSEHEQTFLHLEENELDDLLGEDFESSLTAAQYMDDNHNHSIAWMASVLEAKVIGAKPPRQPVKCPQCIDVFIENELMQDSFIRFKARKTNATQPCKSTFEICKETESFMKVYEGKPISFNALLVKIMQHLPFENLYTSSHFEKHPELGHKYDLIKRVVELYMDMKSVYAAKILKLAHHKDPVRHMYK